MYCNVCYRGEERLRNITYMFLKFVMVKGDLLNVILYNVAVYKNVYMTLNEDLLYTELPQTTSNVQNNTVACRPIAKK
jgi:hypothetical protein